MEQNPSQNQNRGFLQRNRNYLLIVGFLVLIVAGFFIFQSSKEAEKKGQNQQSDAVSEQSANSAGTENQNTNSSYSAQDAQKFTEVGVLKVSDDPARGNLMLERGVYQFYVATKRDFSALLGKQVTLEGQGTIRAFTFLGFKEGTVASDFVAADGSTGTGESVKASGVLKQSDDLTRGNYLIVSEDNQEVYLQSQRDYSAWIGSPVELQAKGTIKSFAEASLTKK